MTEEVQKISLMSQGESEDLVVIPPPDHADVRLVPPICIRMIDDEGRRVHRGWIDATWPIAEKLRFLARMVIGEVWRVSELAEGSVNALSAKHGEKLGKFPSKRIYVHAKWRARDLRVGGYRARMGLDVELRDHVLAVLEEPYNFAKAIEDRDLVSRLEERLEALGQTDVLKWVKMYRTDSEEYITAVFGVQGKQARNTLSQQVRRSLRKAFNLLSNPNDKRAA